MTLRTPIALSLVSVLALAHVAPARAGQADMFGVGSAAMGRGNGGICLPLEAASLFYNPAALAYATHDSVMIGGQLAFPGFADVEGVEWADGRDERVMDPALPPHGGHVGLVKRIAPPVRLAIAYTHPSEGFFYFEQEDPYIPTMVRWRNRPHRMAAYIGGSVRIVEGIQLGVALELTARARLTVDYAWEGQAGDDDQDAVALANMRMAEFNIRTAVRPIAGLLFDFGVLTPRLSGLRLGATYREPIFVALDPTELSLDLVDPGQLNALFGLVDRVSATAVLTLIDFYTPRQVALGIGLERPRASAYVDVTWNQFSKMIPNTGVMSADRADEGGLTMDWTALDDSVYGLVDGRTVGRSTFRDTWTARAGVEVRLGRTPTADIGAARGITLRAGGGYDPGIVRPQSGPTNLMDSAVIHGTLGVGLAAPDPLGLLPGSGSIDVAVQVHRALPVTYDKDGTSIPDSVAMPVEWGDQVSWDGGWLVLMAVTGTIRF